MTLYARKCDLTGKNIISMFNPDVPFPVYGVREWWGDGWEALKYGQEYNPDKSCFEQIIELNNKVPHPAIDCNVSTMENSDYINYATYAKNCYLIFDSDYNNNCYYSYSINTCRDLIDGLKLRRCEYSYECIDCVDCFKLRYCQDCNKCSESYFLKYCSGCNNCFGCVNLRNRSYYWLNKQLTPEEYNKRLAIVDFGSREVVAKVAATFKEFSLKHPHISIHGVKNEGCVGDYLYSSTQTVESYDCQEVQNCRYCYSVSLGAKDLYDVFQFGGECQLLYEDVVAGSKDYNVKFCCLSYVGCQNIEYCIDCISCKNCFACVGLRKKEFCLLNKQYTQAEYNQLKEKMIAKMQADKEYGEFFPASMSHHGYNETTAMFYFPLTRDEALKQGFKWYDKEEKKAEVKLPPDNIKAVDDSIGREIFVCTCGKPYKIIPQELKFYKENNIPLPDRCYICRHVKRLEKRNPQRLWLRKCDKCYKEIRTTYSPERPEIVYCKECFIKEVY